MPTPVYITHIQEEDHFSLSEQILGLNLNNATSTYPSLVATASTNSVTHDSNTHLAFAPTNYSSDTMGSTSITTTNGVQSMVQMTSPMAEKQDCYHAQYYYENMCNISPQYLFAMVYGIIMPKTGFLFSYNGEPFTSYHKKNAFKVGSNHLISKVLCRA